MRPQYPLLIERIQSMFIDLVLIIVLMFLFAIILDRFENTPDWVRITLFVGIWAIYEPLATTLGCTLGQYLKKIRVRQFGHPDKKIHFPQALLRYLVKTLLGWISFLTISTNTERRAMHDYVSGSVMVRADDSTSSETSSGSAMPPDASQVTASPDLTTASSSSANIPSASLPPNPSSNPL